MISVEEALARLLAPLMALPPEQVSVADAVGRVLAEDVAARRTQPPFAVSAMDGYAVRADDVAKVPASLRIVAEIPAGAGYGGTIGTSEAERRERKFPRLQQVPKMGRMVIPHPCKDRAIGAKSKAANITWIRRRGDPLQGQRSAGFLVGTGRKNTPSSYSALGSIGTSRTTGGQKMAIGAKGNRAY